MNYSRIELTRHRDGFAVWLLDRDGWRSLGTWKDEHEAREFVSHCVRVGWRLRSETIS